MAKQGANNGLGGLLGVIYRYAATKRRRLVELILGACLLIAGLRLGHYAESSAAITAAMSPSCTDEAMAAFTTAMQSDHETIGLRPWSASEMIDGTMTYFPGMDAALVRSAFLGRRITILGDSTSRNMNLWLHRLLTTQNETLVSSLATMNVSQANNLLCNDVWESCDNPKGQYPETTFQDGTSVKLVWGPSRKKCPGFEKHYRKIRDSKPQIIIANMGLWWLHLHRLRSPPACVAERWQRYEEWLEELVALAENAGASALILKTTNKICDERYDEPYATAVRLYNGMDQNTLTHCVESYRGEMSTAKKSKARKSNALTDAGIADYCQNGTFTRHGSVHLNRRLLAFVEKRKLGTKLILRVFNDHDIQSCDYTGAGDGRHYQTLNLARLRLLGNLLSCIPGPNGA